MSAGHPLFAGRSWGAGGSLDGPNAGARRGAPSHSWPPQQMKLIFGLLFSQLLLQCAPSYGAHNRDQQVVTTVERTLTDRWVLREHGHVTSSQS